MKASELVEINELHVRNSHLLPANFLLYNVTDNDTVENIDFRIFVESDIYKSSKVYPFSHHKPISKLFSLKSLK